MKIRVFVGQDLQLHAEVVQAVGADTSIVTGWITENDAEELRHQISVAFQERDWLMAESIMFESEGSEGAINDLPF